MRTLLLSPRWLALHAVAILLVAAFVALGWWQLDAYRTSQARHDLRAADAVPLAEAMRVGDPAAQAADQPVTAEGSYMADLVVPARVRDGVLGAYAVGALDTGDGVLIVLRGWAATTDDVPATPSGDVTVTGHILAAETDADASGRDLTTGQIGYLALPPVADAIGRDDLYNGYLLLTDQAPSPAETIEYIAVDELAPIRNVGPWQNLSYWAQWWVFAGAVIVFWVSFVRAGIKRSRRAPTPSPDDQHAPLPRPSAPR